MLVYFVRRRRDIPFSWMFWMFGAFIVSCGFTHFFEVITFYTPMYRLSGLVKLGTAVVSWATVLGLIPLIPKALTLRGPRELELEIAERKRVEEELQRAHDELEQRVKERTAALTEANAALQKEITDRERAEADVRQKNRDLETLLYVTSHDLREPLRAVQSFARLVQERYTANLDDKGKDFLRRIARGADRLDRLLEDILTLSRAQRMARPAEEVKGAAIVAEALDRLAVLVKETGARIRVADNLPRLRVERTWATQAVYNLVANALKFTRPGEPPDVEIAGYEGAKDDPTPGLVVRDRGLGVAPEHGERIFQLFQRAVGREVEGTGAGLTIVRQIAQRHGGRAWVRPRPGGGAEFVITFQTVERNGGNP